AAVVAAQHAALVGDLDLCRALANAIHHARGELAPVDIVTPRAHGPHVVRPLVHGGDELSDLLRRVLQVGIQRDDVVAARVGEARENGHVLTRVTGEEEHPSTVRAALELRPQYGRGTIAAAVIDEYHLVRPIEL